RCSRCHRRAGRWDRRSRGGGGSWSRSPRSMGRSSASVGSVPALERDGLVVLAVVVEGLLERGGEGIEHPLRVGGVAEDLPHGGTDRGDGALVPGVVGGVSGVL